MRPSGIVKMTSGVPVNLDFSSLFIYKDQFWIGANIRSTYRDLFPNEDTGGVLEQFLVSMFQKTSWLAMHIAIR